MHTANEAWDCMPGFWQIFAILFIMDLIDRLWIMKIAAILPGFMNDPALACFQHVLEKGTKDDCTENLCLSGIERDGITGDRQINLAEAEQKHGLERQWISLQNIWTMPMSTRENAVYANENILLCGSV